MITGIFFHFVHDVELSLPAVCSGDPSTGPVARESTDNVIILGHVFILQYMLGMPFSDAIFIPVHLGFKVYISDIPLCTCKTWLTSVFEAVFRYALLYRDFYFLVI